ncbi:hypothetical protein T552_00926 [Pneumocystis carinii B80]|uniref:RRN6 beta-propeller domain-containing protein n=1 Tax=Pneumocystis carinii (strain B80) TaxID=1408658 RepID=A0A0W4ZMV9_PNEC8|nr:hypothetical protein T552_00926 [Pneumocystis carinii B80]KTW29719.1 hypothetical protein T552_00926 [Pneumocystis carinii B80]
MSNWPLSASETHVSLSYGSIGAALYSSKNKESKWSFVKNKMGHRLKALGENIIEYDGSMFFSEESLMQPSRTMQEKYLRTNYPDIWVPQDILKPWIRESNIITSTYILHDPLRGKCLTECQIWDPESRNISSKMFGFVSGINSMNLSLATIKNYNTTIYCEDNVEKSLKVPKISEIIESVFISQTPIRQISGNSTNNSKHILIRNHTSSTLFELIHNHSEQTSIKNTDINSIPLVIIENNDTGNCEHSDVIFDFFNKRELVVINRKGQWSHWDIEGRYRTIEQSSSNILTNIKETDGWWKIDWASSPRSIIVTGRYEVKLFDLRTPSNENSLYSLQDSHNILDFCKSSQNSNDFFVLSTSEIYWLDERQPGKPLLSWKHYRSYDPSLKLIIEDSIGNFNLILYSNINPIKSCYQFELRGSLASSSTLPYELPNSQSTSMTSIIYPLNKHDNKFRKNDLDDQSFLKLYSLVSKKGITSQIYYYADDDINYTFCNHKSLHSVKKSHKYVDNSSENESTEENKRIEDPILERDFRLVDFSNLYNQITQTNNFVFRKFLLESQNKEGEASENYEILILRDIYAPSKETNFDEIFSDLRKIFQDYIENGWEIYSLIPKSQKLLKIIDFNLESDNWNFKNIYDTLIKHWLDTQDQNNSSKYHRENTYELFKDISIELGLSSIGLKPPKSFMKLKKESLNNCLSDDNLEIIQNDIISEDILLLLNEWKIGINPDLYQWQPFNKTSINTEFSYEPMSSAPPRLMSTPSLLTIETSEKTDLTDQKSLSQPFKKIKTKQRKAGF